jgi:glycosyltransferase involved in cell wall biosynthesis
VFTLRIAFFQFYPPTLWTPGGGEVQLAKTKEALERQGVEVVLFNPWSRSQDFDVLHVFGSTHELSSFVQVAKGLGIPVVVSVIAFSNKPRWQWQLWKRADYLLPIPTTYRLRQQIYTHADRLVVMSQVETEQLQQGFRINSTKFRRVPQGIECHRFEQVDPELFIREYKLKDFILQVSRINRHKGQSRLISALEGTGIPLVFLGPLDPSDPNGVAEFRELVEKNEQVHYLGTLNHDDPLLASAYMAARVHVLPSVIEVLPLVILEAAAAGTAVVSGKYPTLYEYFGERVMYCEPSSISSIREVVLKAYEEGPPPGLRHYVLDNFSWERTAERLVEIYRELVK